MCFIYIHLCLQPVSGRITLGTVIPLLQEVQDMFQAGGATEGFFIL